MPRRRSPANLREHGRAVGVPEPLKAGAIQNSTPQGAARRPAHELLCSGNLLEFLACDVDAEEALGVFGEAGIPAPALRPLASGKG